MGYFLFVVEYFPLIYRENVLVKLFLGNRPGQGIQQDALMRVCHLLWPPPLLGGTRLLYLASVVVRT